MGCCRDGLGPHVDVGAYVDPAVARPSHLQTAYCGSVDHDGLTRELVNGALAVADWRGDTARDIAGPVVDGGGRVLRCDVCDECEDCEDRDRCVLHVGEHARKVWTCLMGSALSLRQKGYE